MIFRLSSMLIAAHIGAALQPSTEVYEALLICYRAGELGRTNVIGQSDTGVAESAETSHIKPHHSIIIRYSVFTSCPSSVSEYLGLWT